MAATDLARRVLGLDAHFVTLDRQSARITGSGIQYRGSIPKSSGALVDTNLFLSPESAPVSAVIGSVTNIGTPVNLQQTFAYVFTRTVRGRPQPPTRESKIDRQRRAPCRHACTTGAQCDVECTIQVRRH